MLRIVRKLVVTLLRAKMIGLALVLPAGLTRVQIHRHSANRILGRHSIGRNSCMVNPLFSDSLPQGPYRLTREVDRSIGAGHSRQPRFTLWECPEAPTAPSEIWSGAILLRRPLVVDFLDPAGTGETRQRPISDVKRSYGGRELSKLTVFWNIIVRLRRQNLVRRVRKPRLGRVVPRRCPL